MKMETLTRPWGALVLAGASSLLFAAAFSAVLSASPVFAAGSDKVVATVGNHKITETELDARIKPQMDTLESQVYDLKRKAIDSMVDEYLLEQAAKKQKMTVSQYVQKEIIDKVGHVNEAEAKKYYDAHKGTGTVPFDKIKARLVAALQQQKMVERRDQLVDELRKQEPVKVMLKTPRLQVVSSGHPTLGPANAPVTIVEFGDFQCPFCKRAQPTLKEVLAHYPHQVRLVYMDFPLPFHAHALDAAKAARCANEQGKFWQYHDQLFVDQAKESPADLKGLAKKVGLNTTQFDSCLEKAKYQGAIDRDIAEGKKLGVDGTPSFYIDGRPLVGAVPFQNFQRIIEEELADKGASAKHARAN
jgi:protein-disulfide isomerase